MRGVRTRIPHARSSHKRVRSLLCSLAVLAPLRAPHAPLPYKLERRHWPLALPTSQKEA